jgi:MFS transporter, FSR family, fosmidomycin resistance protein
MTVGTGLDRRGLGMLAAAHLSTDLCQATVPALLPFFVDQRGYSYSAAGALVFAATVGSSLIQPLFGHAADRLRLPWLMPVGVALAGAGVGLAGLAPSYPLTFAAIVVSGIGVAAFHPEAARYTNYASGARQAAGMSVFSVGGNAGFAVGPLLTTGCVLAFGLSGTLLIALLPGAAAALLVLRRSHLAWLHAGGVAAAEARSGDSPEDRWGPFARLTGVISVRSCVHFGLLTFVPVYFVEILGSSEPAGNAALTVMLAAGAAGTLVGGRTADLVGARRILVFCTAATAPLLAVFLLSDRPLAFALIGLVGFVIIGTFAVTVVLGHEYLPGRLGTASGITLGAAIGVGGALAPVLGAVADAYGIEAAMWTIACLPMLGLLLALTLPGRARVGARRRAAETPLAGPPQSRPRLNRGTTSPSRAASSGR